MYCSQRGAGGLLPNRGSNAIYSDRRRDAVTRDSVCQHHDVVAFGISAREIGAALAPVGPGTCNTASGSQDNFQRRYVLQV